LGWLLVICGIVAARPSEAIRDAPPPDDGLAEALPDAARVIEQAKGILMAQHHCGPEEAFGLLSRASQHANVKVRVLAERLVQQVTSRPPGRWIPASTSPCSSASLSLTSCLVRPDTLGRLRLPSDA
jgi:ANTAR domain